MSDRSHARTEQGAAPPGGFDYYRLLGVAYGATTAEITKAYRRKMKAVHPDRASVDRREVAEEQAKRLNMAFTTLSHPESRRAYDITLKSAAVQEQIMGRYVSGYGATDGFADVQNRMRQQATDRAAQRRHDRSATASLLLVFGGIAVAVILAVVAWGVVSFLLDRFS